MKEHESSEQQPVALPAVRVAPLGELRVYVVSEDELAQLEQGSPATLFLNFSLPLISAGVSFFAALVTTDIASDRVFTVFVVLCVLSLIIATFLLVLWMRQHQGSRRLAQQIRDRMPPQPGVLETHT